MAALKRKKKVENKNTRFKLARNFSMIFISCALMALLNLIKIFSDKIFPILGGLTEAEAHAECDLMKIEERWDYKDSFQDCVSYYTSDQLLGAEFLYSITSISLSSMLVILFTLCAVIMLRFLPQKILKKPRG